MGSAIGDGSITNDWSTHEPQKHELPMLNLPVSSRVEDQASQGFSRHNKKFAYTTYTNSPLVAEPASAMSPARDISIFTQRQTEQRPGQGRLMRIQGRHATDLEY